MLVGELTLDGFKDTSHELTLEDFSPTEKGPTNAIPIRSPAQVSLAASPGRVGEVGARVAPPQETALPQRQEAQARPPQSKILLGPSWSESVAADRGEVAPLTPPLRFASSLRSLTPPGAVSA